MKMRWKVIELFKVIELLSVQQINNRKINDNTENFIAIKETAKNKKTKTGPSTGLQNSTEEVI